MRQGSTSIITITLTLIFGLLQISQSVYSQGFYTITAPRTIRPNTVYNVTIGLQQAKPCTIKLRIERSDSTYVKTKTVHMQGNEFKNIAFELPDLPKDTYELYVQGTNGIYFRERKQLEYKAVEPFVIFHTDNGLLQDGDLINYYAIFLNEFLQPTAPLNESYLLIQNSKWNNIKKIENFPLTNGVYKGSVQLSDIIINEMLHLTAYTGKHKYGSRHLEIYSKEYLKKPAYSVEVIEPADNAVIENNKIHFVIKARSENGAPSEGNITIKLDLGLMIYYYDANIEYGQNEVAVTKTAYIRNGLVQFDVEVPAYAKYVTKMFQFATLNWQVDFVEQLTGETTTVKSYTNIRPTHYHAKCNSNCKEYYPEVQAQLIVAFLQWNDRAITATGETKVNLILNEVNEWDHHAHDSPLKQFNYESNVNAQGVVEFELKLPQLTERPQAKSNYFNMELVYKGERYFLDRLYQHADSNDLRIASDYVVIEMAAPKVEILKLGVPKTFTLNASSPFEYFVYNLEGRGYLLYSERIELPTPLNVYNFTITPTFLMTPELKINVYFIDKEGYLMQASATFAVKLELNNWLQLDLPEGVIKPGDEATVHIKTTANSFVALQTLVENNHYFKEEFRRQLFEFYRHFIRGVTGLITFTNAKLLTTLYDSIVSYAEEYRNIPILELNPDPDNSLIIWKNERVPWIFETISNAPESFSRTYATPADVMATWLFTGFSLHSEKGLGVLNNVKALKTFQSFQVAFNMPDMLKKDEIVKISLYITNNLAEDQHVQVTMLNNMNKQFNLLKPSNETINDAQLVQTLHIASKSQETAAFILHAKHIGFITLEFKISSTNNAIQTIKKILKVVPAGITEYISSASFIDLNHLPEFSKSFTLNLPAEIEVDSLSVAVNAFGDITASLLNNFDNYTRLPTLNIEQIASNLMIKSLLMRHLKLNNKLTLNLEMELKRKMEVDYQSILNMLSENYGSTYFTAGQESTWLTAYVFRALYEAQSYIYIDDRVLQKIRDFLYTKLKNYEFIENSEVKLEELKGKDLTAHVLSLMLWDIEKNETAHQKLAAIVPRFNDWFAKSNDLLAKVLMTLLAEAYDTPISSARNDKNIAKTANNQMWWSQRGDVPNWTEAKEVLTTAYMLLALNKASNPEDAYTISLPIVNWLLAQRNSLGGFVNNEASVVALKALTQFLDKFAHDEARKSLEISISSELGAHGKFNINAENALAMQTIELPAEVKTLNLQANGRGSYAFVEVAYQYNSLKPQTHTDNFKLHATVDNKNSDFKLELEVCFEYVGQPNTQVNMALLEIALPTGYQAEQNENRKQIEAIKHVKLVTYLEQSILINLVNLNQGSSRNCLPIVAYKSADVVNHKPSAISLFDYREPNKKAAIFYEVASKFCQICRYDLACQEACKEIN